MAKSNRTKIKDRIWELCKKIIKLRDNNTCQMCGKFVSGSDAHTSHVKNKGKYAFLEFDMINLKLLCFHCHMNIWHKDPTFAGAWFKEKFPSRLKYLDDMIRDYANRTKTIRESDLLELEEFLKQKLSELKGQ